jgi:hypothetical protein
MENKIRTTESGFALLLSIIISSVVLSIGLTLLSVTLKQLNLSSTGRESEIAFHMANLGMECGRYWRTVHATPFTSDSTNISELEITCSDNVDLAPNDFNYIDTIPGAPTSFVNKALYKFDIEVGVGAEMRLRHIALEVNVIVANEDVVNYPIGRIRKNCSAGDVCTVIVSQGYNRSESEVAANSIFAVQRELTAEF